MNVVTPRPDSIGRIIKYLTNLTLSSHMLWKEENGNVVSIPAFDEQRVFALTYQAEGTNKVLLTVYTDKTYKKSILINLPIESPTYASLSELYVLAKCASNKEYDAICLHIEDFIEKSKFTDIKNL